MKFSHLATGLLLSSLLTAYCSLLTVPAQAGRFEPGQGQFMLDGKPFVIKAAELHYPRIPRPYWDQRIKMAKALGMNTICMYVFWNTHEPLPDQFDFTGQNDIAEFVRLCQQNDMYVILRPGPYVCAEWEMGGLPWWLLRKRDTRLRENDQYFMERVSRFEKEVADQLSSLTIDRGGPILMIQVENEYGSYGKDKEYIGAIRDMLRREYGPEVEMFQCDWSSNFLDNGLDDLIWTLNFGTGADISREFAPLREARPDTPLMCSEYWSGWFDKWGANHETRPADAMVQGISEMLADSISFSLYMTHGGTNWGHWAGANSPGYAPDVTSYDYDAPINENGAPTPKYHLLREAMRQYYDGTLPPIPDTIPTMGVERFTFTEYAPLFENCTGPYLGNRPLTMEELGQGFGSILYRTILKAYPAGSILKVDEPHDFAQVFINGRRVGTLDRRLGETELTLPEVNEDVILDILVEATGRINFGRAIKDYKGITDKVTLTFPDSSKSVALNGFWAMYKLEDSPDYYDTLVYRPLSVTSSADINFDPDDEYEDHEWGLSSERLSPGAYKGTFTVETPADTFLDFSTWGKGLVYVNGHCIGRIWHIGPQQTLYVPGCWLREGKNDIMVYDILGPTETVSRGLPYPILDSLQLPRTDTTMQAPDLTGLTPFLSGEFKGDRGWQGTRAKRSAEGRYIAIEFTGAHDGGNMLNVAELYMTGADGNRLPREGWKVIYADSSVSEGNHTPDKILDMQESTYWLTGDEKSYPHLIVIDMGRDNIITGMDYLPRMESGVAGSASEFRIFLSGESFPLFE